MRPSDRIAGAPDGGTDSSRPEMPVRAPHPAGTFGYTHAALGMRIRQVTWKFCFEFGSRDWVLQACTRRLEAVRRSRAEDVLPRLLFQGLAERFLEFQVGTVCS